MKQINLMLIVLVVVFFSQQTGVLFAKNNLPNTKDLVVINQKGGSTKITNKYTQDAKFRNPFCCLEEKAVLEGIMTNGDFQYYGSTIIFEEDKITQSGCTSVGTNFKEGFHFGQDGMYFGYDEEIEESLEGYSETWPEMIKKEMAKKLGKTIEEIEKILTVSCTVEVYKNDYFHDPLADCTKVKAVEGEIVVCSIGLACDPNLTSKKKGGDKGFRILGSNPLGK